MTSAIGIILLSVGAVAPTPVASEAEENDSFGALEEVVVTATRTPKALKDVPVVTRVITDEDIRNTDATDIQDLLTQQLPGLEFGFSMSQETSLSMSGFGGNAVLFLVDGERLAGETLDNIDFSRLSLGDVGRVEVVKGASSALYGANAVGGVVNLISRTPDVPWRVRLDGRYSALGDEWRTGANVSCNTGKWFSSTDFQYKTSKTVRLTDFFDTESKIHNIYGGNSINVKERLTFRPSEALSLTARGGYYRRVSNRGTYDDHYYDWSAGLRGLLDITPADQLELSYAFDQYEKGRFLGSLRTHDHDYTNRQNVVHALYNHFRGKDVLTAGADFMHDFLTTYQFIDNADHSQLSFDTFVQYDWNPLTWLNIIGSVRDDYYSESRRNALTGRLAAMFRLRPLTIRASYAGGFRAPTLKEMYMSFDMAGIQMIYGNPDLKPERSHNFNLSLERGGNIHSDIFGGAYSATILGFCNLYDSRITTTDFPGDADREEGAIYCNEDGVRAAGLDLALNYRMRMGLGVQFNYNYLFMWGNTIDSQFSQPRPHTMTWRVDYEKSFGRFYSLYAGISGRYLSRPESRHETDSAYSIWKFTLRQKVWKGISVNFSIDNLFDYRPKVYYWNSAPTTGLTWSLGLTLDLDDIIR